MSLTPGTVSIDVDQQRWVLSLHALDAPDSAALIREINHETPARPLTHELIQSIFLGFDLEVKKVIDLTERIYGRLEGKVGAAFTTSGGAGCGHETTNLSILTGMMVAGMVVAGTTRGPHFGPFAVGKPSESDLGKAHDMGARIASLTLKLFP